MANLKDLCSGLPTNPLPPPQKPDPNLPHAPIRTPKLSPCDEKLALQNALRYFPAEVQSQLAGEFVDELHQYGHIYMYRFKPTSPIRAYPIGQYPSKSRNAAAIMLMIMNNLDPKVAQYPEELVTYGGNGQVFSNWAQFRLVMHYLSEMDDAQTLVMYSGHPLGLFPGPVQGPRLVITNGMMVPNYSRREDYERQFALGNTMYGQMTAGSYCYIGPQGIVHGTTLTVMNAGRKYLGVEDLSGKVLLTSGLGGMSGAQAKAAVICGCVGVVAEVNYDAIKKRHDQGWVLEVIDDLDKLINRLREAKAAKEATSIAFHGNVVAVWERLVQEWHKTGQLLVDFGSDQTSCHDPFGGGYCPVHLDYDQAKKMLASDPSKFKSLVQDSLRRHVSAINALSDAGLFFWDYGNAFLLEAKRAGADVGLQGDSTGIKFRYPSYVQDMMGDIFSLGFGPFRWVCTSGEQSDLDMTDKTSVAILEQIMEEGLPTPSMQQYEDNVKWIRSASSHKLVVGSQARILYSDQKGRVRLALAFNKLIREGKLKGPVVVTRDHHDVSGTDSPFRETSNITDGSSFSADMAVQNCIGDACRGATWVALHNGGGVGWGEAINGGFGLVMDGSEEMDRRAKEMLSWDVGNGVARRCWSGNANARVAIEMAMKDQPALRITLPNSVQGSVLDEALKGGRV